jgi:hypothetical protein
MTDDNYTPIMLQAVIRQMASDRVSSIANQVKPESLRFISVRLAATEIPIGCDPEIINLRLMRLANNMPQHFFQELFPNDEI